MSTANFPVSLAFTLRFEGGWANNPADPGGATMKGITFDTFLRYYPGASIDDLRNISDDDVADIYLTGYWNAVKADGLPDGVDLSVFDMGVNVGPGRSIRLLQGAVGVTADGVIGPISAAAIIKMPPSELIPTLAGKQKAYYEGLSTFDIFGDGWLSRTEQRARAAMTLIPTGATA